MNKEDTIEKALSEEGFINSLIAFSENYIRRIESLKSNGRLTDYEYNGKLPNLYNAKRTILLLNKKKIENGRE